MKDVADNNYTYSMITICEFTVLKIFHRWMSILGPIEWYLIGDYICATKEKQELNSSETSCERLSGKEEQLGIMKKIGIKKKIM
jgi:hypothetical protein